MATKWLAFFLFFIQVDYLSCCVFDKVKEINIGNSYLDGFEDKNKCFAACYANKECYAVELYKKVNRCYLCTKGEITIDCADDRPECYVLQRDEAKALSKEEEKVSSEVGSILEGNKELVGTVYLNPRT
ncbi:unnamed protein product [Cylicocyclus nassatus]|uniref:Uncharacterized protein n=1 Tax=Cylicocyclus nassatus TaxID=53992 RepID=A0AA36M6R8_CYLNA|nr:unnamed protein product [Cylicocyclus nassatus]